MNFTIPSGTENLVEWRWDAIAEVFGRLHDQNLHGSVTMQWLKDWERLDRAIEEIGARLLVDATRNTLDSAARARYSAYLKGIAEPALREAQRLREKVASISVQIPGFEHPLRKIRTDVSLFSTANIELFTRVSEACKVYDQITGVQSVTWDGRRLPVSQLTPLLKSSSRATREKAWRLRNERQLEDRGSLNSLWVGLLSDRVAIAQNAGCRGDFRDYSWKKNYRFDYAPDSCFAFHEAIRRIVVPETIKVCERRADRLGVNSLRPWDLDVSVSPEPDLRPFADVRELVLKAKALFQAVDPSFGEQFARIIETGCYDLESRQNKAPGGFCQSFRHSRLPFIFMNATSVHRDVEVLLHEAGHAFHANATFTLEYPYQSEISMEVAELASMTMELLGLARCHVPGTFYSPSEATRARREHFEGILMFLPYMAMVDAFQHWVYAHPDLAIDPAQCDEQWQTLESVYLPCIDWSDLDDARATGWHRKQHIFQYPFYYIEYGIAQIGALRLLRNARADFPAAVERYKTALALGGTVSMSQVYESAGAPFALSSDIVRETVGYILDELKE